MNWKQRPTNWKLYPEDIERIKEASLFGAKPTPLARAYGVGLSTIHSAKSGRTFMESPRPVTFELLQKFCLAPAL